MFSDTCRCSWDLNVVSFLGIRPHLGGDGQSLLVVAGWALCSLVGPGCGRFCGGAGRLTLYGDGVVVGWSLLVASLVRWSLVADRRNVTSCDISSCST